MSSCAHNWHTIPSNNGFASIDLKCVHSRNCFHETRTATYVAIASGVRIAEMFVERGVPIHPHFKRKSKKIYK